MANSEQQKDVCAYTHTHAGLSPDVCVQMIMRLPVPQRRREDDRFLSPCLSELLLSV